MRVSLVFLLLLACGSLQAQNQGQIGPKPAPSGPDVLSKQEQLGDRKNQRVELIRLEDSGSRIDEVRYGGQTQSITVQPKAGVPEYEIQPTDMARSRPADHRDGLSSATGQRVWNVFKF